MNNSTTFPPPGTGAPWTSAGTITICNREYGLLFSKEGCDGPCLNLVTEFGSGSGLTIYPTVRSCCGKNYADFAIGDPAVCTGTEGCGGPDGNVTTIRVAWVPCNWSGDAWYCARDCGTDDDPAPVELTLTDIMTGDLEIVSGPYNTEAEAILACGGSPLAPGENCQDVAAQLALGQLFGYDEPAGPTEGFYWFGGIIAGHTYRLTYSLTCGSGARIIFSGDAYPTGDCTGIIHQDAFDRTVDCSDTTLTGCIDFTADSTGCLCIGMSVLQGGFRAVLEEGACP